MAKGGGVLEASRRRVGGPPLQRPDAERPDEQPRGVGYAARGRFGGPPRWKPDAERPDERDVAIFAILLLCRFTFRRAGQRAGLFTPPTRYAVRLALRLSSRPSLLIRAEPALSWSLAQRKLASATLAGARTARTGQDRHSLDSQMTRALPATCHKGAAAGRSAGVRSSASEARGAARAANY